MPTSLCRRRLLARALAGAALAPAPWANAAPAPRRPPTVPRSIVNETLWGVAVSDPYRWMEDATHPDWLPMLRRQNAYARATLDATPERRALARRIATLSGDTAVTGRLVVAGERLFYEQRPAGADSYKLFLRQGGSADRVLIDPTTLGAAQGHQSLDWWQPSHDGKHLVYGLSAAGSEASLLHVMAVDSGQLLPERIAMTDSASPSWLPDGSGFFYNQLTGQRGTPTLYQDSVVKLHRLGTAPESDPVVLRRGLDAAVALESLQSPNVIVPPRSDQAIATVSDIRREHALYVCPLDGLLAGRARWRRAFDFEDLVTSFAVVDDELYLLSNRDAPRGRVLRTSLSRPDLAAATQVMAQGTMVIESLDDARDGVYVGLMDGGVQRLSRIARDGSVATVTLPFEGSVDGVYTSALRDGAHVGLAGWLQPSGVWRVEADGRVHDTGITPRPRIDLSPYEAQRRFATARDGVRVPYTVLARKGWRADGRNPTLVDAYGAYQSTSTPFFSPRLLAFLDAGGLFVSAGVRGGGEYGREWHQAGRKATKPNTWRDVIDVGETLVRERITAPAHLAIMGGSAGGIAVGRALTERPDLFAAVVSNVGWSNPIRYMAEQNIADIDEWGPAVDAESFRIMLAMDSYQAVRDGVAYPAVLCTTGATDPRVAPWHAAKFAARLQAASRSGHPILLRVDFDAGHGIGSTRRQTDALFADIFAFVLWRTRGRRVPAAARAAPPR